MGILSRLAQVDNENSLSNRFRSRRFRYFEQLFSGFEGPVSILDVGGTVRFWECRGWAGRNDVDITLLNLFSEDVDVPNIKSVAGDATNLSQYEDNTFDVVFSNSVIEHLFTYENQKAMASEVQRVGKAHWIQTPNYWFPFEPHFHWLGWHWYPRSLRVAAIQKFKCGHRGPIKGRKEAEEAIDEVRIMTKRELRAAFPASRIWSERLLGLTKSHVAISGFPAQDG